MNPEIADAQAADLGAAAGALEQEITVKNSRLASNGQVDFDYGQLDGESWQFVQNARDQIKRLGKQTVESIVEIGRLLTEVKARLPHGQWLPWLQAEFRWSETTARRFMDSYSLIKSAKLEDLPKLLELPPSAIADLGASSTPELARQEVLAKVKQGEKVKTKAVKAVVAKHKPTRAVKAETGAPTIVDEPKESTPEPEAQHVIKTARRDGKGQHYEMRVGANKKKPTALKTAVEATVQLKVLWEPRLVAATCEGINGGAIKADDLEQLAEHVPGAYDKLAKPHAALFPDAAPKQRVERRRLLEVEQ
jgi:Protein of unknown function (DUF3102)